MSKWHDVTEAPRLAPEVIFDPDNPWRNYTEDLLLEIRKGDKPFRYCSGWASIGRNGDVDAWRDAGLRCGGPISDGCEVTRWAYMSDVLEAMDNGDGSGNWVKDREKTYLVKRYDGCLFNGQYKRRPHWTCYFCGLFLDVIVRDEATLGNMEFCPHCGHRFVSQSEYLKEAMDNG